MDNSLIAELLMAGAMIWNWWNAQKKNLPGEDVAWVLALFAMPVVMIDVLTALDRSIYEQIIYSLRAGFLVVGGLYRLQLFVLNRNAAVAAE